MTSPLDHHTGSQFGVFLHVFLAELQSPLMLAPYDIYDNGYDRSTSTSTKPLVYIGKGTFPSPKEIFSMKGRLFSNFERYCGKIYIKMV